MLVDRLGLDHLSGERLGLLVAALTLFALFLAPVAHAADARAVSDRMRWAAMASARSVGQSGTSLSHSIRVGSAPVRAITWRYSAQTSLATATRWL